MNFSQKAFLVGVVGDLALQSFINNKNDLANLEQYFIQHGPLESATIAGGLMYAVSKVYELSELPLQPVPLFLYGGFLDIIFRQFHLYPSLNKTYYQALTPIQSWFWGGVPLVLPLLLPL